MNAPEFSRMIDLRQINEQPVTLEPNEDERRRLAGRFALPAIHTMQAVVALQQDGAKVTAKGRLTAQIDQSCAISGEDFPVSISEPLHFRFVPARGDQSPAEEIELDESELDEIEYEGTAFDLGEAVAQSLALAIDPFAEGPNANAARQRHGISGEAASGAFAALSALRKDS